MRNDRTVFRREKSTPDRDAWYTLRLGLAIFAVLLIVLPPLLG